MGSGSVGSVVASSGADDQRVLLCASKLLHHVLACQRLPHRPERFLVHQPHRTPARGVLRGTATVVRLFARTRVSRIAGVQRAVRATDDVDKMHAPIVASFSTRRKSPIQTDRPPGHMAVMQVGLMRVRRGSSRLTSLRDGAHYGYFAAQPVWRYASSLAGSAAIYRSAYYHVGWQDPARNAKAVCRTKCIGGRESTKMSSGDATTARRLFVSYSRHDAAIVGPVVELLRSTGAPVFRDADRILPGKKWRVVLEDSLQQSDAIVLFWSVRAKESLEVEAEWHRALQLRKDIIPVLLDDTRLDDSLSEYQYIDFRSIIRVGHPWESILEELAQLILLRLEGISEADEDTWWKALRHRWRKN